MLGGFVLGGIFVIAELLCLLHYLVFDTQKGKIFEMVVEVLPILCPVRQTLRAS